MGGCDADDRPGAIRSVEQALDLLLSRAHPPAETEWLPIAQALGRVTAAPLRSPIQVPPWDNSAMDGYALRRADLKVPGDCLPVAQRIPAGRAPAPLVPGTAARIFTGAPLPPGADAVVPQELCVQTGDQVCVRELPRLGAHVRRAGEDIQQGQETLPAGTRLGPQHLALAAALGMAELPVYRRPRVALVCSGDELVMPGTSLGPGQIYNSNQYLLAGLVQTLGCEVLPQGILADNLAATQAALAQAAGQADLVLVSGGVSVGEEDHVRPALERLGRLDLWRVAMRPGKPLAFGQIGATPCIGFPGNPVSLFVTFCLFARPFILACQGMVETRVEARRARAGFTWNKPDPRREYARARLTQDADGQAWVGLYPNRSPAVLSSLTWANGLAIIPEGRTLALGDPLDFLPFSELLT